MPKRKYTKAFPSKYDKIQDRKIRKLVAAVERKTLDATISESHVAAGVTWDVTEIVSPQQGDSLSRRDGEECLLQSLFLRLSIGPNNTATNTKGYSVRIAILAQKVTSSPDPIATDIWETDNINGMNNVTNVGSTNTVHVSGNFQFYYDKTFNFNINAQDRQVKIFIKFPGSGLLQKFGGAGLDAHTNRLYFCWVKTVTIDQINIVGNVRLRFIG